MKASSQVLSGVGLAVLLVVTGNSSAQPTTAVPPPAPPAGKVSGPKIHFAEPIHDFGRINSGTLVKHEFKFSNQGDQTLEVTAVQPSCGCTTAGEWSKKVEPGQTGTIPIQFNSGSFGGPVSKSVTVTCNDPTQQVVYLQIKASIWRPIDINPNYAVFNVTAGSPTNETRSIRIVNNLDEPLTVSDPVCTNRAFKAELKTLAPGKEFEVVISLLEIPTNTTSVQTPITLTTSSSNMPLISVSAFAMVQPAVMISPTQIILPAGPLATNLSRNLIVRNNHVTPMEVSEPSINAEGVEVQVQPVQAGRYYNVTLRFPTGFEVKPGQKIEFSLKSNLPQYPVLKVPVYQPPRPVQQPAANWQLKQPAPGVQPIQPRTAVRPLPLPPAPVVKPVPPVPPVAPAPSK